MKTLPILLTAVLLALVGCGSDDETPPAALQSNDAAMRNKKGEDAGPATGSPSVRTGGHASAHSP